jgi:TRAP-type C4-dicarboxylate transport system permease small subunit
MKVYKKIMDIITVIENIVLSLSMVLVTVLTFGNVVARKVFHHSWGFTEEIVVAVFVLISLLAAGVAARSGELVNLALLPDNVGPKAKKVLNVISTVICTAYSLLLAWEGYGRIQVDHTLSPILHIPKTIFWSFVVIGGISLALHFVENCIDFCSADLTEQEDKES